jgi:lipopolysaccharide export system permease protein
LIIDRYISWEILRLFCGGLGMLILVFVGYSAARQLSLAAEGQMGMSAAFTLIGLNTLIVLEVLLPSALFFSVLAAIGRMYRDGELPALYAAGVSPARILESVAKLSLVIALITGFVSIAGRPWAYRESYRIEADAAASFDPGSMVTKRVHWSNRYRRKAGWCCAPGERQLHHLHGRRAGSETADAQGSVPA